MKSNEQIPSLVFPTRLDGREQHRFGLNREFLGLCQWIVFQK